MEICQTDFLLQYFSNAQVIQKAWQFCLRCLMLELKYMKSVGIYDIDITSRGDVYAKGGILALAWHIN